ncbi:hypothetical protein [Gilvimarinus japonicus]|uniref:Transposase n=1 Tax=Gilvimarinus japonicus TaxID=1796469 RepID=A0ABV7HJM1_9GAMM
MADKPETSDFTSAQERLGIAPSSPQINVDNANSTNNKEAPLSLAELLPFAGNEHDKNQPQHIPFNSIDYLQLIDWTGRAVRSEKRGAIDSDLPAILQRLNIHPNNWLNTCCHIEKNFGQAIGPATKITELCESLNQRWIHGISQCRQMYSPSR